MLNTIYYSSISSSYAPHKKTPCRSSLKELAMTAVTRSAYQSLETLLAGPTSLGRGDVLTAPSALACCPASKVGGDGVCGTMRGRTLILALSTRVAGVLTCPGTPGLQFCGARRFRGGVLKVCIVGHAMWRINQVPLKNWYSESKNA